MVVVNLICMELILIGIALVSALLTIFFSLNIGFQNISDWLKNLLLSLVVASMVFPILSFRVLTSCSGYCYFVELEVVIVGLVSFFLIFGISYFLLRSIRSSSIFKFVRILLILLGLSVFILAVVIIYGRNAGLGELTSYNTNLALSSNDLSFCYDGYDNYIVEKIMGEILNPRDYDPWTIAFMCESDFNLTKAVEFKDENLCKDAAFCDSSYLTYLAVLEKDVNHCDNITHGSPVSIRSCYVNYYAFVSVHSGEYQCEKISVHELTSYRRDPVEACDIEYNNLKAYTYSNKRLFLENFIPIVTDEMINEVFE